MSGLLLYPIPEAFSLLSFSRLSLKLAIDIYHTYGSQFWIKDWIDDLEFKKLLIPKVERIIPQLVKLFTENIELISKRADGSQHIEEEFNCLVFTALDEARAYKNPPFIKQYVIDPPIGKFLMDRGDLCQKILEDSQE